ncbi:MAG: 50S ribosomal protein L23 [Deltaproteobacteria bacterium CG11_big_fil_rev_8_21_14_0_20_42_23]|nr:MAG: 50S ribosomal protein L23 [Deltaproteobacteria bacterium CG11_big_fil_rev_8_21_14_0_20_42_23]PJC64635.1 MAG: 50S ribosomal protein L23 [Deltaproteobacteria bacterium CG_4_9_14_0_2_um_filter_42_21]
MNIYNVIDGVRITEKAFRDQATGMSRYVFRVDPKANKYDIRNAVQQLFNVTVTDVNTMQVAGKRARIGRSTGVKSDWKKAIVTLKQGDKIEIFEGA